jgi:hypothetical protein
MCTYFLSSIPARYFWLGVFCYPLQGLLCALHAQLETLLLMKVTGQTHHLGMQYCLVSRVMRLTYSHPVGSFYGVITRTACAFLSYLPHSDSAARHSGSLLGNRWVTPIWHNSFVIISVWCHTIKQSRFLVDMRAHHDLSSLPEESFLWATIVLNYRKFNFHFWFYLPDRQFRVRALCRWETRFGCRWLPKHSGSAHWTLALDKTLLHKTELVFLCLLYSLPPASCSVRQHQTWSRHSRSDCCHVHWILPVSFGYKYDFAL